MLLRRADRCIAEPAETLFGCQMYYKALLFEPAQSGNARTLLPHGSAAFIPRAEARGLSPRLGNWEIARIQHLDTSILLAIERCDKLRMMTNMPIRHPFRRPAVSGELPCPLLLAPIAKGRSYFCARCCSCR